MIAEAGVNHDGDLGAALELVAAAHAAGADAVKFQTFRADALTTRAAGLADYQRQNVGRDGSQRDMLAALELGEADFQRIGQRCRELGIDFISSPFDLGSVDLLERLGVTTMKVPSGEITNLPLLERVARQARRVVLSTGASWLSEVEVAVRTLRSAGASDITLLHCVSEYPSPVEQSNLLAMATLRAAFGLPVGFSDHTLGTTVTVAAVSLGAVMIEKHLTLDRSRPGPDHAASLDPDQFASLVAAIREVEAALGDGVKRPMPAELQNRDLVRKSVVTTRPFARGEPLVLDGLTLKRPGTGVQPGEIVRIVGRRAARDIPADHTVSWDDVA